MRVAAAAQTRDLTAYHEAGHVVVAYRFNHNADRVTIVQDSEAHTLGQAATEGPCSDGSNDVEVVTVLFAGGLAERRRCSRADRRGSRRDEDEARELLRGLPAGQEEGCRKLATSMVEDNWLHIEAVATALLEAETLSYDEWTIVVDAIDEGEEWRPILEQFRAMILGPRVRALSGRSAGVQ